MTTVVFIAFYVLASLLALMVLAVVGMLFSASPEAPDEYEEPIGDFPADGRK